MSNSISQYAYDIIHICKDHFHPPKDVVLRLKNRPALPLHIENFLAGKYINLDEIGDSFFENAASLARMCILRFPIVLHEHDGYDINKLNSTALASYSARNKDFAIAAKAAVIDIDIPYELRWRESQFIVVAQEWSLCITDRHFETEPSVVLARVLDAAAWEYWPTQSLCKKPNREGTRLTHTEAVVVAGRSTINKTHTPDFIMEAIHYRLYEQGTEERDMWRAIIALGDKYENSR